MAHPKNETVHVRRDSVRLRYLVPMSEFNEVDSETGEPVGFTSVTTKEEVESYKDQDPIENVRATILKNKYATESTLSKWDDEVKEEVAEAVKFAEDSPAPEPESVYDYIYSEPDYPFVKD